MSGGTEPTGLPRVALPQARVTLVEGTSFCVSAPDGELQPDRAWGLFVRDTRVLSTWRWSLDGEPIEALTVIPGEPYGCYFIGRAVTRAGNPEPTVIVERHRLVAQGMREDITVRNFGAEACALRLCLQVGADFADLFHVKEGRGTRAHHRVQHRVTDDELSYWWNTPTQQRGVRITAQGAVITPHALSFEILVEPGSSWSTAVEVIPSSNGQEDPVVFPTGRPVEATAPARRMRGWRSALPDITVDNPVLAQALATSQRDLGALRIVDPEHPGDEVVAAGAPWFMALFGRDSLITSHLMVPYAPDLAMGTLRTLARLQGTRTDPVTEEQPGRILHEVRLGVDLSLALGGENIYFGSIDSTPLFVMLVGQVLRWGVPTDQLAGLRGPVDRAIEWIDAHTNDAGFVTYQRSSDRGLQNQGWKDSLDAVGFRNGALARTPIALAEVQGYCYAAQLAAADLAAAFGDHATADRLRGAAERLKTRFHEAFWMPQDGFYAMALDGANRQVDAITSNIGHCLWSGIVPEQVAGQVIDRLLAPDMFTGFGIRTLAHSTTGFNPASYHRGSVWPHDTVIGAAGMAAYGHTDAATRVLSGLLDALEAFNDRLPELFCGFDRPQGGSPVPYPTSCSPQAWASAVPYELLRIALGLTVDVTRGQAGATPTPDLIGTVHVHGLRVGGHRVDIDADPQHAALQGLPPGLGHPCGTTTRPPAP